MVVSSILSPFYHCFLFVYIFQNLTLNSIFSIADFFIKKIVFASLPEIDTYLCYVLYVASLLFFGLRKIKKSSIFLCTYVSDCICFFFKPSVILVRELETFSLIFSP